MFSKPILVEAGTLRISADARVKGLTIPLAQL